MEHSAADERRAPPSRLVWQVDRITFDIKAASLHLSRSDLIRVAEAVE